MSTLHDIEKQVDGLTRDEKSRLLDHVARQLGVSQWSRGIESVPGVCGGDPCVAGTRIPVWLLESYRRMGMSEATILDSYPTITARDVRNAWEYAAAHQEEIDMQIRRQDEA
ncbi:MAG: DUF433 domain-containing protein [Planctomycetes bacterium]|nr:DUF433 domain-containing protein [Planctomycetota bacterium]